VKWYNDTKGFGFVVLDGGGKEVFVPSSALKRAGITRLNEGQRVFVGVAEGRKGPEATSIQLANYEYRIVDGRHQRGRSMKVRR